MSSFENECVYQALVVVTHDIPDEITAACKFGSGHVFGGIELRKALAFLEMKGLISWTLINEIASAPEIEDNIVSDVKTLVDENQNVLLSCNPRIRAIFRESFPGHVEPFTSKNLYGKGRDLRRLAHQCELAGGRIITVEQTN